jgi:HSP20 family protein
MNNLMIRRHPLSVMNDLDNVMDAVFGDLSLRSANKVPAVDVVEEDTRYLLKADIPGFDEKEVEIKIDGQLLTISGKAAAATEGKQAEWLIRERRAAAFCRSFTLPRDVDSEGIKANSAKGVLTVELPKNPKAQPRTIDIKTV